MQATDRDARRAKAAEEVSKLMLSGWSMTAKTCPVQDCYNPLYSKPGDRAVLRCPHCGVTLKQVDEGRFVVTALDEDSPVRHRDAAAPAPEPAPAPAPVAAPAPAPVAAPAPAPVAAPAPETSEAESEYKKRQERSATASRMMGQRMLAGFAMLDEYCSTCGTPLMRSRAGVKECVLITSGLCDGTQPGEVPAPAAATAPAAAASSSATSAAASGAGADDVGESRGADAGISAEEAARAFEDVLVGTDADMAGGPAARQLEFAPEAGLLGVSRVDTDALMRRALQGGVVGGATESKEGDSDAEDADEDGGRGSSASAIEALREARREVDRRRAAASASASASRVAPAAPAPAAAPAGATPLSQVRVLNAPPEWQTMTQDQLAAWAASNGTRTSPAAPPAAARSQPQASRPSSDRKVSAATGRSAAAETAAAEAQPEQAPESASETGSVMTAAHAAVVARIAKATSRLQAAVSDAETTAALAILREAADTLRSLKNASV